MPKPFRQLTLLLTLTGLLLAACGRAPQPATIQDLEVVSGPHYAQLYWSYDGPAGEFELEQRTRAGTDEWSAWSPAGTVAGTGRSALVAMEPGVEYQFRLGLWAESELRFTDSAGTASLNPGVTLQVGTMNRGDWDEELGTVFLVFFDLPADVAMPLQLSFVGPAGWADGPHPLFAGPEHLEAGYLIDYLYSLPPLTGTYMLTLRDADGQVWTDSVDFTQREFRLSAASELVVTDTDLVSGTVAASWTPPVPGARTQVALLNDNAARTPFSTYVSVTSSSHEFTGLDDMVAGLRLILEVASSNLVMGDGPPVMPQPFGIAVAERAFTVLP